MAGLHATRSPSGSPSWTLCLAKINREAAIRDTSDKTAANRGTICHDISAKVLQGDGWALEAAAGKTALLDETTGRVIYRAPGPATADDVGQTYTVDQDIIDSARAYTQFVKDMALGGQLEVEQRLPIEHITGEQGATGTSDAVILFPDKHGNGADILIADLKSGREVVHAKTIIDATLAEVTGKPIGSVMPNTQLMMYASGAVRRHQLWHDIRRVCLIIVQPPLNHVDEIVLPIDEFLWWVEWIRGRALLSKDPNALATPGATQCKYCRYAAHCPELRDFAVKTALANFDELGQGVAPVMRAVTTAELPRIYGALDLVETWCAAVRHRMYIELTAGTLDESCGWKLVMGRKGNRYWTDPGAVRNIMEQAHLTRVEMYRPPELVSPTVADDTLAKAKPELWNELQLLIDRADGKLTVAPTSDERPAVKPAHDAIACFDAPVASAGNSEIEMTVKSVQLGDKVRNTITGFVGVCVARTEWLNGCWHMTLQPPLDKDGKLQPAETFDEMQLEVIKSKQQPAGSKATGGPRDAPTRACDPV